MTKIKHLFCDIDGVLFDFVAAWQDSEGLERRPATRWKFYRDHGFDDSYFIGSLSLMSGKGYLNQPHYTIDEGVELVRKAIDAGVGVTFFTHRPKAAADDTRRFLKAHDLLGSRLVIVDPELDKVAYVNEVSAASGWARNEVLIFEDKPDTIRRFDKAGYGQQWWPENSYGRTDSLTIGRVKELLGASPPPEKPVAMRRNSGKPPLGELLQFDNSLVNLAMVLRQGGIKYEWRNWLKGGKPDSEYLDAALRHLRAHANGETYDTDTGCLHLAHAMWNIGALQRLNYRDFPPIDPEFDQQAYEKKWSKI